MGRLSFFLSATAAFLILGRMTVPGHGLTGWPGLFEAVAHMLVGALIAIAVLRTDARRPALWLLVTASLFELAMFKLQNG